MLDHGLVGIALYPSAGRWTYEDVWTDSNTVRSSYRTMGIDVSNAYAITLLGNVLGDASSAAFCGRPRRGARGATSRGDAGGGVSGAQSSTLPQGQRSESRGPATLANVTPSDWARTAPSSSGSAARNLSPRSE